MSSISKIILPLLAVAGLTLAGFAQANSTVLATVNGKTITQQDYDQFVAENAQGQQVERRDVINELVTRELVYQDATRKGLEKRPEVKAAIEAAKVNVILGSALELAVANPPVSEADMRKLYQEEIAKLDLQEFKARHILVADKTQAERIITELDMGGNFQQLAKQHSSDSSADNGGDLGWFPPQQMVPEFSRAVMALDKGKYTKQPVQSQFGWHVILKEDSRKAEPPAYEAVKPQLRQIIERQRLNDYLQGLHQKGEVKIN